MEFRVLGPLQVVRDGREIPLTSGRQRTVLACLLLRAGRLVPVTTLIDRLWGDDPPSDARGTLQVHVLRLRRALDDPTVIGTRPDGYLITAGPDDLRRFDELTARAERARRDGDPAAALKALRDATSLWRGPILADVASASLHTEDVPQLTERCMKAVERRYELELLLGQHETAVAGLRTLTAANPHREPLHVLLMRALYRSGRQAEALAVYDRAAAVLRDDLGLDPGDELQRARQAILTRTDTPARTDTAAPPAVAWRRLCQLPSPAADFVGREGELARLGDLLDGDGPGVPVVTVTGQSGVGKTALAVHAAHRLRDRFPDAQLYASLTGRDAAEAAGDLLRALGVPAAEMPGGLQARAAMLRGRLADRRVLLVLDDVAAAAQVEALLPGTRGSAVLVTSRRLLTGLPGNRIVRLGPFTGDEADALLRRLIGDARVAAEPRAARRVAAACGHLPLALRIAGARLAVLPSTRLDAFARRLEDHRRRLDELALGGLEVRAGLRAGHGALDAPARRAFERLGLLANADVPGWLLRLLVDGDEPRALESLVDANLLHSGGADPAGEPRYRLPALTADFAAELAGPPRAPGNRAALARVVRALAGTAAAARDTRARSSNDLPVDDPVPLPRREAPMTGDPIVWLAAHRALLGQVVEQACAAGLLEEAARLVDLVVPLLHRQVAAASLRRLREAVRDAARAAGHEPIMWREEYGLGILSLYAAPHATTAGTWAACAEAFERLGMTRELTYALSTFTFVRVTAPAPGDATAPEPSALAARALRLARASEDHHAEIIALAARADALAASGRDRDGLTTARTALRVARTLREPHFEATALSRVSRCSLTLGDVDGAAEACTRAMRLLDDLHDRRSAAWLLRESACIAQARGRRGEAIGLAERAAAQFLALGDRHGHAAASATLADLSSRRGQRFAPHA
ncbi:BTAD domain-containing putative transcriptional regulator [Actinomadura sp. NPDC047616]|uniref:AfsR/SARP family transcriptional regulator n=1 Tax=Actinomadura sp. NPDC047616 TaxID=3155914 RepID=UPI0033EA1969